MNLTAQLIALKEESQSLNPLERAKRACDLAKQFEKAGEYESAYEALSEFWPDRSHAPRIDDLDEGTGAELMLRAGAVAGRLGSADQTEGSQETAKDFITRSMQIFDKLGDTRKAVEAQADLGLCYWREGSYDEARIHLANALSRLGSDDSDLRATILIRAGIVEGWARRLNEAMRFYNEAAPLVERSNDHSLKGAFHNEYGMVFRRLASPENREDYLDRALIEYAAASFHFEQAGNERYVASAEGNLGYLYFTIGRYKDAHAHLDRARHLFIELKDAGTAAQVDDTRARTLLAENRPLDAERIIRQAIKTLERGGEQALLAEALTTYGVVLARLGRHARARELLDRAVEVAETTGDLEGAGRAKLSIIEELTAQTSARELAGAYEMAVMLLKESEDPATTKRIIQCALKVIDSLTPVEEAELQVEETSWDGFSFKKEVLKIEKSLIERALRDAGGSVTRASRLLGFRHHQSLIALINSRHRDLLGTRSAVRKRRRHLFSKPRRIKKKETNPVPPDATAGNGDIDSVGEQMLADEPVGS
jgi:tetratricopeptide (TPR) repeat protein